jgi:hypothetical protein
MTMTEFTIQDRRHLAKLEGFREAQGKLVRGDQRFSSTSNELGTECISEVKDLALRSGD